MTEHKPNCECNSCKKKIAFTNKTSIAIIIEDAVVTFFILVLAMFIVDHNYLGTLPFLVTLIGLQQAKTTIVLTAIVNKSKAENTQGGIVYDMAVKQLPTNIGTVAQDFINSGANITPEEQSDSDGMI